MKFKFEGTPEEFFALLSVRHTFMSEGFDRALTQNGDEVTVQAGLDELPPVMPAEAPKRTRRTKAEIEAAKVEDVKPTEDAKVEDVKPTEAAVRAAVAAAMLLNKRDTVRMLKGFATDFADIKTEDYPELMEMLSTVVAQ